MIIVTAETKIFGEERKIFRITVKGHSGYADAGHDIVCAGVSSAFEYMANLMTDFFSIPCGVSTDPKVPIAELRFDKFYMSQYSERNGYIVSGLVNGFIGHIKNIESEFTIPVGGSEYIKVITKDL